VDFHKGCYHSVIRKKTLLVFKKYDKCIDSLHRHCGDKEKEKKIKLNSNIHCKSIKHAGTFLIRIKSEEKNMIT
jgi:hypothetical protein